MAKKILSAEQVTINFLTGKKKEMKESKYRKKFDNLAEEIRNNLVNTTVSYGEKLYERSGWGSVMTYTKTASGNTDMNVYPQKLTGRDQNRSGVPVSQEPIAFSKIITAASVLAGKVPDATVTSDSKVYSKTAYELWKRTWTNNFGNGPATLINVFQNLLTYGWAAWRVYPRRVQTKRNGVDKIIFDDIYREALDPNRVWLGIGFNNYDRFSQFEVYYEKDMPIEDFLRMYPAAIDKKKLEFSGSLIPQPKDDAGISEEASNENNNKQKTHVTIGYYENMLANRFIVACGKMIIFDGEMPNDDGFGSIVVARCFSRDMNDPYGVGMYEMMRGNTAIYTYINSLNAQQVEAEIFPILFGAAVQNGTATYKRGPNVVNPKTPGSTIDIIRTTGNLSAGIQFGNQQKEDIEQNTGINNIVAGQSSDTTLGGTMILAEAALKRLVIPRNSVVDGLEIDAIIGNSWIKQTYSVDKVFMMQTEDNVQEFLKQNPDYFVQSSTIEGDNGEFKGFAVVASQNLRLNYDFDEQGNLMEDVPTRKISAKQLFTEMNTYGHSSPYVSFQIDPTSMLLPSQEIQKQQYAAMFPMITNQLSMIFAIRMQDPQAAATQLKALECLLKTYKENIYNYMSKNIYDEIMAGEIPKGQIAMQQLNKQLNPDPNAAPTDQPPGQSMTPDGTNPMEPQAPQEVQAPQGPFSSAVDASMGRAAAMGAPLKR